MKSSIALPKK